MILPHTKSFHLISFSIVPFLFLFLLLPMHKTRITHTIGILFLQKRSVIWLKALLFNILYLYMFLVYCVAVGYVQVYRVTPKNNNFTET